MINELYSLSVAIQEANIPVEDWHPKYLSIPNVRPDAPCIRLVLEGASISLIESVSAEKAKRIRKYGDNQSSFPAMNLAPLYRVTDTEQIKRIKGFMQRKNVDIDLRQIRTWCGKNNWGDNLKKKIQRSLIAKPRELVQLIDCESAFESLMRLVDAVVPFQEPSVLHDALTDAAFRMLEEKNHVEPALRLLFHLGNGVKKPEEDFGTLSVVMDTSSLEKEGLSTTGIKFTQKLNAALCAGKRRMESGTSYSEIDAFGSPFAPSKEPLPKVKICGGATFSLRTMFKEQHCQYRYGKVEAETYPLAAQKIIDIKSALEWLSKEEMKNKTWISTGKEEFLFVYPSKIPELLPDLVQLYDDSASIDKQATFEAESKYFAEFIAETRKTDPEYCPDLIQLFFLRKLDKARGKVIYTRNASPEEIIRRSDLWQKAADNLPVFFFGKPNTLFPLRIHSIMDRAWSQDGEMKNGGSKVVSPYHGLELLFGVPEAVVRCDLQALTHNTRNLVMYVGTRLNTHRASLPKRDVDRTKETLALMGMFLFWLGSRKEIYMNEYPYLLGQMLKVSDGLHELYCLIERDGQLPNQLVGSGMYVSASEQPRQCLGQLSQRMMPYLTWAKTHRGYRPPDNKGPSAGYYLAVYSQIANRLEAVLSEQVRFSELEKAQLFIGYLASFPKIAKDSANQPDEINLIENDLFEEELS